MTQWGTPHGAYPQYPQFTPGKPTDGVAIMALILALSSLVFWIVPAVVALFLAPRAKARVRAADGATRGLGLITASQIVSIVSLAIALIVLVALSVS